MTESSHVVIRTMDQTPISTPFHIIATRVAGVKIANHTRTSHFGPIPHPSQQESSQTIVQIIKQAGRPYQVIAAGGSDPNYICDFPLKGNFL